MVTLINLLLAIVAGCISLYVLRSAVREMNDGLRVVVAIIIGIVVFLANLAQYIVT